MASRRIARNKCFAHDVTVIITGRSSHLYSDLDTCSTGCHTRSVALICCRVVQCGTTSTTVVLLVVADTTSVATQVALKLKSASRRSQCRALSARTRVRHSCMRHVRLA